MSNGRIQTVVNNNLQIQHTNQIDFKRELYMNRLLATIFESKNMFPHLIDVNESSTPKTDPAKMIIITKNDSEFISLADWLSTHKNPIKNSTLQKFAFQLINIVKKLHIHAGMQHNNLHEGTIFVKDKRAAPEEDDILLYNDMFEFTLDDGDLEVEIRDFSNAYIKTTQNALSTPQWAIQRLNNDHWWSSPIINFIQGSIIDSDTDMYMIGSVLLNMAAHGRKLDKVNNFFF